jgi:RNA polymerase sigma-70 factor (ECF subfamily)
LPPSSQPGNEVSSISIDPYLTRSTLIARVKNQYDASSWDDFSRIYRGYIYAIIRNMNISVEDAEDLVQQLLLKIWKKLPNINTENIQYFRGWLAAMTRNFVKDFIQRQIWEADRMDTATRDETLSYLKTIRLPDIDRIAEHEWRVHLVNLALNNIKPEFSGKAIRVFQLSMKGIPADEIAKQLDLKKDSVKRLKTRVKTRLLIEVEQLKKDFQEKR